MISKTFMMGLLVTLAVVVGGCKTTGGTSTTGEVEVEDLGSKVSEGETGGAEARGLGDEGAFQGSPLDDPNSPLSVRVIYFDYDSSEIKAEYRPTIEAHAAYLASHPDVPVTLEGNADERGSREYNLALGDRRAEAVRRQLILLSASAGQIRTVSYGEERPAALDHDESAWSLNRRVEIVY
ncbi:MAG: peptidoglycan-associated lipoprotein Pal [Gammaproteobacteria bacterium]|nr:peptidoglycan-associated lipoprotein Pal [Gammaproteobacteria bacterium]MCI0590790.1 peptidoglycan-associated lipoprotein Pal [Gammaproteobacteria bacterium]